MKLIVNAIEEIDYNQFKDWWIFWEFPIIPKDALPNNGFGGLKMTDENGVDLCAGYLYETNSSIAWIEFIVSNPSVKDRIKRKKAKIELIYYLTLQAEQKGYKSVFSSIKDKSLINSFLQNNYTESFENTKELSIKL